MGAPVGSALSIAGAGFSAYGQVQQAKGVQAGDEARADQLARAADRGRTAAAQTSAQMTEDLNTTLGNISVVRAAANIDPTSPTTAAILSQQEYRGNRARDISVENLIAQADENDASANYMRQAGAFALSQGKLGAFATILKSVGSAAGGSSFGLGSSGPGGGAVPGDPEMALAG